MKFLKYLLTKLIQIIERIKSYVIIRFTGIKYYEPNYIYFDKFNEEHVEYHYIDPVVGGGMIENPPITRNAVIDLIELHHQAQLRGIGVSLSEATPAVLISKYGIAKEVYKDYPRIVKFLEWQRPYK